MMNHQKRPTARQSQPIGLRGRLEAVSVWERLFDDGEGVRLTNAYHQSAWPGELGFEFVTAVQRQLPWGADTPRPSVIADALYTRPTPPERS